MTARISLILERTGGHRPPLQETAPGLFGIEDHAKRIEHHQSFIEQGADSIAIFNFAASAQHIGIPVSCDGLTHS